MSLFVGALALLLGESAAAPEAATCPPPHLCALEGSWGADGVSFGKPSHVTMIWEPMLGGKFARVRYAIAMKGEAGPAFEGVGVYRPMGEGRYEGVWFDSQGAMHPLKSEFDGKRLTTLWGVEGGTLGRTVYALKGYGEVEIVDEIQRDGAFREFSRNTLKRAD